MNNPKNHFKKEKSAATRSKHELLSKYIRIWQGMVLNSLRNKPGKLLYLDTCAGSGLFPAENDSFFDKVGSPLIGIDALIEVGKDKRFHTANKTFYALLFEKDQGLYKQLIKNLAESEIPNSIYKVFNSDYRKELTVIQKHMSDSFVLAFFDPFNIEPLDFNILKEILQTGKTDAIIYFPAMQIQRYQGYPKGKGFVGRDELIDSVSKFFGSTEWIDLIKDVQDGNRALEILTNYYIRNINKLGKHALEMDFLYESQRKILYKIILATKNTEALLQAKRLFSQIEAFQESLRERKIDQLLIFNKKEEIYEMEDSKIASDLYRRFKGQKVKGEDIYSWAAFEAGDGIFKNNVRRAVTILGKQEKVENPKKSKWNAWDSITFV